MIASYLIILHTPWPTESINVDEDLNDLNGDDETSGCHYKQKKTSSEKKYPDVSVDERVNGKSIRALWWASMSSAVANQNPREQFCRMVSKNLLDMTLQ